MFHPSDADARRLQAIRDGQVAPVTCAMCGCRLERSTTGDEPTWFHFGRFGGRDARGDRTDCVEQPHDAFGRSMVALPA
jgi:hypothetical protein